MKPAKQESYNCKQAGYTLTELLIVVVILGVFASISVSYVSEIWKGQIAIANLENMRAWLESVRRSSLRGEACTIEITTNNLRDGSRVLESEIFDPNPDDTAVESTPCGSPSTFQLESPYRKEYYVLTAKSGSSNINSFIMTPRGTLYNSSASPTFSNDLVFSLSIANSSFAPTSKSYCLRMSSFLGTIQAIGTSAC